MMASGITQKGQPMDDRTRVTHATTAAFLLAVLIGGSNFVAVKFSNGELPPMYGAAVRFSAAAVVLVVVSAALSLRLPQGRALIGSAVYGVLNFGAVYALLYFALLQAGIGLVSVIMATVPLFTLVLAVAHRQEQVTTRGLVGGALAVAGIAVLSLRSLTGHVPVVHLVAAIGAAAAAAEATVLVKGFPRAHPVTTNAAGMAAGALVLWLGSALAREHWRLPHRTATWLALAWLVVAGSVGLFYLVLLVIRRWTASAAAYVLTLMPVVAVALGAVLAGEPVTPDVVVGALLVLLAVYVGAIRQPSDRRRRADGTPYRSEVLGA